MGLEPASVRPWFHIFKHEYIRDHWIHHNQRARVDMAHIWHQIFRKLVALNFLRNDRINANVQDHVSKIYNMHLVLPWLPYKIIRKHDFLHFLISLVLILGWCDIEILIQNFENKIKNVEKSEK